MFQADLGTGEREAPQVAVETPVAQQEVRADLVMSKCLPGHWLTPESFSVRRGGWRLACKRMPAVQGFMSSLFMWTLCVPNSEDDRELLRQVSSESYRKRSPLLSKTNEHCVCHWETALFLSHVWKPSLLISLQLQAPTAQGWEGYGTGIA